MSVLASTVITRLDSLLGSARWTDAQKLEAINTAIDESWPHIRRLASDSTQTIASGTYTYSPSATPETEYGYAAAYATLTAFPDTLLRRVSQSQSGTTFTIHLDPQTATDFNGYTLKLIYTARIARVTAASDSIELPLDYLFKASALWLLTNKMLNESKADTAAYEKLIPKFERDVQMSLGQHQRGLIAHLIPRLTETATGAVTVFEPGVAIF